MRGYSPTVVELGREREWEGEKNWTKENSRPEKHKRFPSSWTNSQQAQLCFLYIVLFGLCQKYVPQDKHIFIIQQGFWYFENEVSSITNKGLLSGVCHHMGVNGREREREPPLPVHRITGTVAAVVALFWPVVCAEQMFRWHVRKRLLVIIVFQASP